MYRFKSILIGMLSLALVGALVSCSEQEAAAADAKDWKKSEHNWNINWEQFNLNIRNNYRSDYDHVELGMKMGEPFTLSLRTVEEDGAREYRPKIKYDMFSWDGADEEGNKGPISLSLGHQLEYRYYEADGSDRNWRYRTITKLSFNVSDDINAWVKVQPRWEFGQGKEDDIKIDNVKNQVGVKINLDDNVSFSPYVEYHMDSQDKDFERTEMFIGTALSFKY